MHPNAVKQFIKGNHLEDFRPSLDHIKRLGTAFQKIPYENLTKIIRSKSLSAPEARIRLPEILLEEHLRFGTGGTCFSMTYFLQTILKSLGLDTYPVMADRPLAPDTHCASIIILEGKKYLLDPGFIIDEPLLLTDTPTKYALRHNNFIIGLKGTIPIPENQMKYFNNLKERSSKINLPYETPAKLTEYTIATINSAGNVTIRYFLKDEPVQGSEFLDFWLDSFNWPTLNNISISVAKEDGYLYARNNFIRTTTNEGKTQTHIKKHLELTLGKTFNIETRIIRDAFETLRTVKKI